MSSSQRCLALSGALCLRSRSEHASASAVPTPQQLHGSTGEILDSLLFLPEGFALLGEEEGTGTTPTAPPGQRQDALCLGCPEEGIQASLRHEKRRRRLVRAVRATDRALAYRCRENPPKQTPLRCVSQGRPALRGG